MICIHDNVCQVINDSTKTFDCVVKQKVTLIQEFVARAKSSLKQARRWVVFP